MPFSSLQFFLNDTHSRVSHILAQRVGRLIITYSPYKTGLVIKQRDLIVYGNMGRGPIVQISNVYPMTKGLFGDPDSIEFVLKEHQLPGSDVKYYNMEIGCVYQ